VLAELQDLVGEERVCCAFVSWAVTEDSGQPVLRVAAPPGSPEDIEPIAAMFAATVNVETVRYYERRGLMAPPGQSGRGRYGSDSVRRLALIRRAKALKFALAEIGERLDAADDGSAEAITVAATAKLAQVEAELRELATLRCRLTRLVRACSAGEHTCVTLQTGPDDDDEADGLAR
jgi:DNA-binding transcriptional MerR regulator